MVDGAGRASLAQPIAGALALHRGPRAAGESGRPRALPGGLLGSALAQHRLWREGKQLSSGGSRDPHPRGRRQETSRACAHARGPDGFHGDPHATGRAGGALGSHLVQPQWGLPPAPGRTDAGPAALGLLQSQTARVSLFPQGLAGSPQPTGQRPDPWPTPQASQTSQLHLCQPPKPCSAASLDLCPSPALCLEGLPQPYPSKALLQYALLQEALPDSLRRGWSACSSGLGVLPPVLISCQTIWGFLEDRGRG